MSGHTPTPWVYSPERSTHDCIIHAASADDSKYGYIEPDNGGVIGSSEWIWISDEDGEFIVRAANAHDELLAGLRAIVERADNGELGTSKVQDMKRLAADLLAKHGGAQ